MHPVKAVNQKWRWAVPGPGTGSPSAGGRQRLKAGGLRVTPRRLAILEEVSTSRTHPTAEEIYYRLKPQIPSLSLTTVYRTLEALAQAGELRVVTLGGGASRYDGEIALHHHVVCLVCGRIQNFTPPGDCLQHCPEEIRREFRLTDFTMVFRGICRLCQEGESSPGTQAEP